MHSISLTHGPALSLTRQLVRTEPLEDAQKAPVQKAVRATNELLRHFWGCYPLTTPARCEKAARVLSAIDKWNRGLTGKSTRLLHEAVISRLEVALRHGKATIVASQHQQQQQKSR